MPKRKRLDGYQLDDIKPVTPKPRLKIKFVEREPRFNEVKDVVCITTEIDDAKDVKIMANGTIIGWLLKSGDLLLKTRLQEEPIGDKFDLDDEGRIKT